MSDLVKLNLGCGQDIAEGFVNVDLIALPGVDVVADLDEPWPWKDGTVEYIKASHVYEHVRNPVLFMTEAHRVLAPGGLLDVRVPGGVYLPGITGYWIPHQHAFTDPTHRTICTPLSWDYWCRGTDLYRAYGPGLGGGPDGATFDMQKLCANGEQQEELQCVMQKPMEDDGAGLPEP